MENKDLAKNYLGKILESAIYFKKGNFPDMPLYNQKSIIDAFNAGRKSVVENMPELKWNEEDRFGDFCECTEEGYSNTPFGIYSILQWYNSPDIAIYFAGELFKSNFQSVEHAKQAANEDYKKRIKQALGL